MIVNVLSIAGSDPSGGAGIQADLKTFSSLGAYGMAVITALTAQNTQGVRGVHVPQGDFVRVQIDAIFEDIEVHALKTGMLANADIIKSVALAFKKHKPPHIVLDPVMAATSGDPLIDDNAIAVLKKELIPLASVITPNIREAELLLEKDFNGDIKKTAHELLGLGAKAVLLKGGHFKGLKALDVLATEDGTVNFEAEWIETKNTHGTGCTLSAALAAYLAQGLDLPEAVKKAKIYLTEALRRADELDVGHGHGPVHHLFKVY